MNENDKIIVNLPGNSVIRDLLIVFFTALLACAGALIGTHYTIKSQNKVWFIKTRYHT